MKEHSSEDSSLFTESKNKKPETINEDVKVESKEIKADESAKTKGEV